MAKLNKSLLVIFLAGLAWSAKAQLYLGANFDYAIPKIQTQILNDDNRLLFSSGASLEGRYIMWGDFNLFVQAGYEQMNINIRSEFENSQDYRSIDYALRWSAANGAAGIGLSLGDEVIGGDFTLGLAGIYPASFRQSGTYMRDTDLEGNDTTITYQNKNLVSGFEPNINIFFSFNVRLRLVDKLYGNMGFTYRSGHDIPYEADLYNDSYERQHIIYRFLRFGLLMRFGT